MNIRRGLGIAVAVGGLITIGFVSSLTGFVTSESNFSGVLFQ